MGMLSGHSVLLFGSGSLVAPVDELVGLLGAEVLHIDDQRALRRLARAEVLGAVDFDGGLEGAGYPIVRGREPSPEALVREQRLVAAELVAKLLSAQRGVALELDAVALLTERMAHTNFEPNDTTSVGGSATMISAANGWMALNLARPEDIELLPALLGQRVDAADWPSVRRAFAERTTAELENQAALLGLPLATVGGAASDEQAIARRQQRATSPWLIDGRVPGPRRLRPSRYLERDTNSLKVLELASLWAGPLCGRILRDAGCAVIKAESTVRPDGARRGSPTFFAALNDGKEPFRFDHTDPAGLDRLRQRIADADVVIDGSRPRVMDQWGVEREAFVRGGGQWVSITGYGATGPWANRVAFGDDAAASAGLVTPAGASTGEPPRFYADAAADPMTGLYAAIATLAGMASGSGHHLDLALREVAGFVNRPGS